jgi:hypothetical protein
MLSKLSKAYPPKPPPQPLNLLDYSAYKEVINMKMHMLVILILLTGLLTFSCATNGYNTQKGAAIGAGIGAIAGQIIGNNTAGTLIGAAGGALAGAIVGNAIDQDDANRQVVAAQRQGTVYYTSPSGAENPPGQWVEIPGQWVGGKWIPAHRAWVPVNP